MKVHATDYIRIAMAFENATATEFSVTDRRNGGRAALLEAAKILLAPWTPEEESEARNYGGSCHMSETLRVARFRSLTEPEKDPAVEAVKAEMERYSGAIGSADIYKRIVAAVRLADADKEKA